jgi:hypothetical protein
MSSSNFFFFTMSGSQTFRRLIVDACRDAPLLDQGLKLCNQNASGDNIIESGSTQPSL